MTTRMHAGELEIDELLVRRLLVEQFAQWSDLPLRRVEPSGTDHAIFRLGDELSVRLPRVDGPSEPSSKEFVWLPRLAAQLPVEVPVPVSQGRPGEGYPWFWEIHTWVDGETVPMEAIDALQAARDLAALIEALQRVSPAGAPAGRGIPLANATRRSGTGWRGLMVTPVSRLSGSARWLRRRGTARLSGTTGTSTRVTG